MMFHREARLPIEADVEQNETVTSEDIDTETTADAFIEKMLKRQEDIKSIAGENIKKSQKKQKECYDKRHSPEVYNYTALYILYRLHASIYIHLHIHVCECYNYVRSIYDFKLCSLF